MNDARNESAGSQSASPGRTEKAYDAGFLKGVTPNILKLGIVSFLADVSSEMLYPVIPLFITVTLGAPVALMGLIEGVADATSSIFKLVSGRWSDRAGERRKFVISGYLATAIGKALVAVSYIWPVALLGRAIDRLGKGIRTSPRDALLADSVSPDFKGKAFGIHRGMDTAGAVVGPLVALLVLWLSHENLRLVLWLAVIPGFIAPLFIFAVRDIRPAIRKMGFLPRLAELPSAFRAYLVAIGIFALVNSSDVFLLLKAKAIGFTISGVILLYVAYNLVYALGSPVLGQLSDRIGRKAIISAGMVVFALVYCGLALARAQWQMWLLFAIYGLYIAATEGVGKAFAADLVPAETRGSAMGAIGLVAGIGALFASTVGGVLWTAVAPWATFAYGAAGALISLPFIARVKMESERRV